VHPDTARRGSIVAGTIWAMVWRVGDVRTVADVCGVCRWIFYALGGVCARAEAHATGRPRRSASPAIRGRRCCSSSRGRVVANTIATQPGRAAVGIGVVLLGLPVYFIWRNLKSNLKSI